MCSSLFPLYYGMLSWTLPFGLSSHLRSFDTESEESRWVFVYWWNECWLIQQVQLVCSLLDPVKSCHTAAAPPTLIPVIVMQHVAACSRASDFCSVLSKLSHQPVLLFLRDPYLLSPAHGESSRLISARFRLESYFIYQLFFVLIYFSSDAFSNVVIEGVMHGVFYPHLQPR